MAQDVRPYKSKEQDGQGNEIILRDQQLVEQTSQTTMASGEYFEIVDVDGRMAKIPKDNMIGVVREALGSLLNGLADQTTVTKALTLNGDTLGASTAATLASVLGVVPYILSPTADIDSTTPIDDTTPGVFRIGTSASPFNAAGILYKFQRRDSYCQLFIGTAVEIIGYRIKGSPTYGWSTWKSVTLST